MKIKQLTWIILLLCVCYLSGFAQTKYQWKTAQSGGYIYKYVTNDPSNARYYTLKNGLSVILSPSKLIPRIQTYIAVKAGSKTDPADHTGLAHYLEHMLFKGTQSYGSLDWSKEKPLLDQIDALYEKYNQTKDVVKRKAIYTEIDKVSGEAAKFAIANEYDKIMTSMGAEGTNAFTSFEQTVYTEDIPANNMDKYLTVQAERFNTPVFRIFHTELEAVYEEKNRGLDNDGRKSIEKMFEKLFPNNNYGKQTTIGAIEHLKNPSLKAIREYFNTYYVPNNMGIIMSGDFNPDEVIAKIEKAFSYMKPKPIPLYTFSAEKPIQKAIVANVVGPNPESVMLGYRFPGAASRDAQLLNLIGEILTNGSAGLMDLELVKKQKLLAAQAFPYVLKDYSLLILYGMPNEGQSLDEVRSLMLSEIDKLKKGNFPESLLKSIVNNRKVAMVRSMEDYKNVANTLMENFTSETDWSQQLAYIDFISKLSKQDIVSFANKYFGTQNYVAVYKRKGEDKSVVKVEKPPITPVSVNRDAQSPFLKMVNSLPEVSIQPLWLDFQKDIEKGNLNTTEILAVKNTHNDLFNLKIQFDMGKWNNIILPIALGYVDYIGTKDKTAAQFSQEMYELASDFSINAGSEESQIYISGLNENLGKTFALVQNLLSNCVANEESFTAYIAQIKKSRIDAKANKNVIINGLQSYAGYGRKNPFNYVMSDNELNKLKAEDLIQQIHQLMEYKHKILYYGKSNAAQLAQILKESYAKNFGTKILPVATNFKQVSINKNQVLFAQYDMVQAEVFWVRNNGTYNPNQEATVGLFNSYFGEGMGSIVFQTIRESKALAYSTYAYYANANKREKQDIALAYVGTQADKFKEAVVGMNELINVLPETEKGFETAKTSLIKTLASQRITKLDIIETYLANQKLGVDNDIRKEIFETTPNLTFDDIKAFHHAKFAQKPFVYCIISNQDKINIDEVKKLGKFKQLTLEEIFGY